MILLGLFILLCLPFGLEDAGPSYAARLILWPRVRAVRAEDAVKPQSYMQHNQKLRRQIQRLPKQPVRMHHVHIRTAASLEAMDNHEPCFRYSSDTATLQVPFGRPPPPPPGPPPGWQDCHNRNWLVMGLTSECISVSDNHAGARAAWPDCRWPEGPEGAQGLPLKR